MTLLIDNYDSFAYNLYQYVGSLDPQVQVIRNDDLTVAEIEALHPTAVILSPRTGPTGRRRGVRGIDPGPGRQVQNAGGYAWGTRPFAKPLVGALPTPRN